MAIIPKPICANYYMLFISSSTPSPTTHTHTHTHAHTHTCTYTHTSQLWGGEVELVALSKLYGRPLVVYNEQDDSVQEQVFPSVEEDEHPTSTEELRDPVSAGDTHDLTPIQSLGNDPHHPT